MTAWRFAASKFRRRGVDADAGCKRVVVEVEVGAKTSLDGKASLGCVSGDYS